MLVSEFIERTGYQPTSLQRLVINCTNAGTHSALHFNNLPAPDCYVITRKRHK